MELYSDSKYVLDALQKGWVYGWKKRGWVKSDKKPALNPDLWDELLRLESIHTLRYHWVKGHAENEFNNRCDELAVAESRKFRSGRHFYRFLRAFVENAVEKLKKARNVYKLFTANT